MDKQISISGKQIFYQVFGSGKPVVLIHGFGEDSKVWKNQIEFLNENFLLIVPDLPGSGKSEMIEDMSIEGMAEVIKIILDTEAPLNPPQGGTLIGHSMGGYITLAFAEKYPEYLNGFGLFHSTAYADSDEKKEIRKNGIAFIKQHGAYKFLKTAVPNLFSMESKKNMAGNIEAFIYSMSNFSADALVSYYEAMMQRPDRTSVLRNSNIPVLFIMGKYDQAVPLKDGLELYHLPQKSYIHILHKSGHMGMLEEADESNRFLDKFLRDV